MTIFNDTPRCRLDLTLEKKLLSKLTNVLYFIYIIFFYIYNVSVLYLHRASSTLVFFRS